MLGIVLIIGLLVFWILQYKAYVLKNSSSGEPVELDSIGRRFEVNECAVKYRGYSILIVFATFLMCAWPFLFMENVETGRYIEGVIFVCFFPAMFLWGAIFIFRDSKGYVRISENEIELDRRKQFNVKVDEIKRISYNGFGRFDIHLKEKKKKYLSIFTSDFSYRSELFILMKKLRKHVAVLNGRENSFTHKFATSGVEYALEKLYLWGNYIVFGVLLVFASICCIDDEFNKRDYYSEFNKIGYDASQKENAWDYYVEVVNSYVNLDEKFEDQIEDALKEKNFETTDEQKVRLLNWFRVNQRGYESILTAGTIDYCYVEYEPGLESETYKEVEQIRAYIKSFNDILRFGYYSGTIDIELSVLFDIHLASAKHCIQGRDLISQLIGYGLLGKSMRLLCFSKEYDTATLQSLRKSVLRHFPSGVPRVNYLGERISMYTTYGQIKDVSIKLPYSTPLNPIYILCGSPNIYRDSIDSRFDEMEYSLRNNIEIKEKPLWAFPLANTLFMNIMIKGLGRSYHISLVADSSVSAFDLIFDLEEYNVRFGNYPASIDELQGAGYEVELPDDVNGDGKLKYLNEGSRAVLYSVGDNGEDERGHYDGKDDEGDRDDLVYWEKDI